MESNPQQTQGVLAAQALATHLRGVEADLLATRDRCVKLESKCKRLQERVNDLEDGRSEERSKFQELRFQLMAMQSQLSLRAAYDTSYGYAMAPPSYGYPVYPPASVVAPEPPMYHDPAGAMAEWDQGEEYEEYVQVQAPRRPRKGGGAASSSHQAEEVIYIEVPMQPQQAPTKKGKKGIAFRENDSLLEIDNAVTGEQVAQPAVEESQIQEAETKKPAKKGIAFRERESLLEIDNAVTGQQVAQAVASNNAAKTAKKGIAFRDHDSLLEIDNAVTGQQVAQAVANNKAEKQAKKGIVFREHDSLLEIDNAVTGQVAQS